MILGALRGVVRKASSGHRVAILPHLAIREHYKGHPDGPYSYSQWDSAIPRPEAPPTHARWLKQYLPMVEEGTWAWLELAETSLFASLLPNNVAASAFANGELYLVLANYGVQPVEVGTPDERVPVANPEEPGKRIWKLGGRSLHILRRKLAS